MASRKEAGEQSPAVRMIFEPLLSAKAIVLAVSGGPDSVALMLMAADWVQTGTPPLYVATVDHDLRAESRFEAEQVALWAKALGLPHRILTWEGEKPKTRLQERARDARYALLTAYAAEVGADHIVTAHHADDQAETILFRLLRGSGLKGLAGMATASQRGDLTMMRPLLSWAKDDLIAFCQARGQLFFDDPSNRNPAYARTRLRRLSGILAENGLDRQALLRLGARAARADAALRSQALSRIAALEQLGAPGAFRADISTLRNETEEVFSRILELAISMVRQDRTPLRLDRLESLGSRLHGALVQGESFSATLGGTALNLDRKAHLSIRQECLRWRGRTKGI